MDLDYVVETGVAAVVANLTATPQGAVVMPEKWTTAAPEKWTTAAPAVTSSVTEGQSSAVSLGQQIVPAFNITTEKAIMTARSSVPSPGRVDDVGRRLEEGLRQVEEGLRQINRTPTVIVINQPPPSSTSGWQPDVDGAMAGAGVVLAVFLLLLGCWWLRRYRPDTWKRVKSRTGRVLQAVALPASWLCGLMADQLRKFHSSTEEQPAQQAAVSQVRLFYIK